MKVKIYEKIDEKNEKFWLAYDSQGNFINNAISVESAEDCEAKARCVLNSPPPKLVKEFEV